MPDNVVPSGTFGDYGALITNTTATPNTRRNEVCQISGFKAERNELVRNWDGSVVKVRYRDDRHPQEFQRVVPQYAKRRARAESDDVFIDGSVALLTEAGEFLMTEDSGHLQTEGRHQVTAESL